MISFGQSQTKFQRLAQDRSESALDFFKSSYNEGQRLLETEIGAFASEEVATDLTLAGIGEYKTPDQFLRLKSAFITVGSREYPLEEVLDEDEWRAIQRSSTTVRSDIARLIFVRGDTYEIYPKPSNSNNTITLRFEATNKELSFDDYSEGHIVTLANASTAITGGSTAWTTAMAGRFLKILSYPVWYKLTTFGTVTTYTLNKKYTGISIAAGTESYVIGEMPRTPESTHSIPIWYGLFDYYQGFKQNKEKATYYKALYEQEMKRAKVTHKKRVSSNYIPGRRQRSRAGMINPNNYPEDITY